MIKLYYILQYEIKKFFKSARSYVLLLTGTVPLILFLSISAEKSRIEFLVTGRIDLIQNTLLVGYVFYSYILAIFFTIMVFSDILSNEKSYEFLLVSASRTTILLGKICIVVFLNVVLLLETFISFLLTLFTYNVQFPPLIQMMKAFGTALFISVFLVIPVILFSNTAVIKLGNVNSSMANYLAIFIFFVIPFIIYFSLDELQLFQPSMLKYSVHTIVKELVQSVLVTNTLITAKTQMRDIEIIAGTGIVGYIVSIVLFSKSSIIS